MNPTTTPERSRLMKRVRQRSTPLEIEVRRMLYALGGRYRVNVRDLPGSPDIANKNRRLAIFVNGCFWHHHEGCAKGRIPKRNRDFWKAKLEANKARDARKAEELTALGFRVLVVWECELASPSELKERIRTFWW